MNYRILFTFMMGALLLGTSCKPHQMLISENLKNNAPVMPVKGRYGLLIGQQLSFGSYQTGEVERGWIKSSQLQFFMVSKEKSKQAINFTLNDSLENTYIALCVAKVSKEETDLGFFLGHSKNPIINDLLTIPEEAEESFAVGIESSNGGEWNMLVANRHFLRLNGGKYQGILFSNEHTIEIAPIRHVEGTTIPFPDVIGFEFKLDGEVVAAVELLNKGRVWINPAQDDETRGILATACAALLLQTDLETL